MIPDTITHAILFIAVIFFAGFGGLLAPNVLQAANVCDGATQNVETGRDCNERCKSVGIANARPLFNKSGWKPDNKKCCCQKPDSRTGGRQSGAFDVNPLGIKNIPQFVGSVIRELFGVIGIIALAIFIYGGALWMLSLGDEQRVTRARETMIWAGLGILAVFGSYVVVQFILDSLL